MVAGESVAAAPQAAEPVTRAAGTTEDDGQHVEVDQSDDTDDNDSALGDDSLSAITSLSSSIKNHTYENGRRYHAFRSGTYFAPNDEAENDRLDMHHHLATLIIGGKLTTAPIGPTPQRILDIGCGTGIWSIAAGDEYPSAQIVGVDLSPTQPSMIPPNVQFEVDDVEEEWTYRTPFDLVHVRFMAASISDWPKLVNQTYAHTKPGGWVEFKDWDPQILSTDNSLSKDSYIYKYHKYLHDALEVLGRPSTPGPGLKNWVKDAGFINITAKAVPIPIGMWAKEKSLKEIGAWNLVCLEEGLEAICMRLFTTALKMSLDEFHDFITHVKRELKSMKSNKVHAQYTYYIVTGQRPEA